MYVLLCIIIVNLCLLVCTIINSYPLCYGCCCCSYFDLKEVFFLLLESTVTLVAEVGWQWQATDTVA